MEIINIKVTNDQLTFNKDFRVIADSELSLEQIVGNGVKKLFYLADVMRECSHNKVKANKITYLSITYRDKIYEGNKDDIDTNFFKRMKFGNTVSSRLKYTLAFKEALQKNMPK